MLRVILLVMVEVVRVHKRSNEKRPVSLAFFHLMREQIDSAVKPILSNKSPVLPCSTKRSGRPKFLTLT